MKLGRRKTAKADYVKRESAESFFIPVEGHWDSNILMTKNSELLMVIRMEGFAFETADDEDIDMRKNVRNTLFKSVASAEYALWIHVVRRKQHAHAEGEFYETFSQYLNDEWDEKHVDAESFINEIYLTVIRKKDTDSSAAKITDIMMSLANKADVEAKDIEMKSMAKDLKEISSRMLGSLKDYKPTLLGLRETENGVFSEPLEFFGSIVNCASYSPMLVPAMSADKYIPTHRLYFGKRALEVRSPTGQSKFAGSITIREYATYTSAGMLDTFLQLPFEFVIAQSYVFINRQKAIGMMSMHQRRMSSSGDKAVSQMVEITEAMDMASGGQIAFGEHHLTVMVAEDSLTKLETALSLCYGELVNIGVMPSRDTFNLQASYWAQLPGNFSYISRGSTISTMNLAGFASFHNYPTGRALKNHWGPAITVLDTTSGTPFFFNFHVRDVGHSTIIGPTGAGKTVTMNFLCGQAQKYKPRMFFFDKDRGAEIFIRALGGVYSVIEPSGATGFNPLQLADTPENRTFLTEWIKVMCMMTHDQAMTPEETERIADAVKGNFKLPPEQRKLSNIAPFMGLEGPGSLASRLRMWHSGETHAGLFDNPKDELDFSRARVFGFEMQKVLQDGISLSPVLLYLFHKINLSLDGTPTMIVLDEAWALIDNEIFAPKIKDWLKVLRKLNAMVIFATQSVEDIAGSSISDTLVQQTTTQIFLPNAKATEIYCDTFMLSQREYVLIKTTDPGTRYFLVKQGPEVVVARIDLSGMDNVINVLSGRTETVILLDEIRAELGTDPDDWLETFYIKARDV